MEIRVVQARKARKANTRRSFSDPPNSSKPRQTRPAALASVSTFATSKASEFRSPSRFCCSIPSTKEFLWRQIIGSQRGQQTIERLQRVFGETSMLAVTASWDFCKVRFELTSTSLNFEIEGTEWPQTFHFRHRNSYQRNRLRHRRFAVSKASAQQFAYKHDAWVSSKPNYRSWINFSLLQAFRCHSSTRHPSDASWTASPRTPTSSTRSCHRWSEIGYGWALGRSCLA